MGYASFDSYADDFPLLERGEAPSSSSSHSDRHAGTPPSSTSSSGRRRTAAAAVVFAAVVLALVGVVALLAIPQSHNGFVGTTTNLVGQDAASSTGGPKGGSSEQQAAAAEKKASTVATTGASATSKVGSNNTPPPTPAPTYLTTMVYVIQRVDGVTLEQSLDSTFESAFVAGILKGSSMKLTLVKYVESKSALYGAGVDCEYFVEAKDTNPEALTAVRRRRDVPCAQRTLFVMDFGRCCVCVR